MGIRVDFLIKHVRPYGMEAWMEICGPRGQGSLHGWLLAAGVSEGTIKTAFDAWAVTANLTIDDANLPQFVQTAQTISEARWSELYNTDYSTILFLNHPLLKELSWVSSKNSNRDFEFSPQENIPLAVTIHRNSRQAETRRSVAGAHLRADQNGDCFHFGGLILQ